MFLLLKDNRIIDTVKQNCKPDGIHNGKETYTYDVIHWFYKEDIIKESENLYDLIQVGDLIRYYDMTLEVLHLSVKDNIVVMETSNGVHLPSVERFLELTTAIYKLDSETGNYIKVWKA